MEVQVCHSFTCGGKEKSTKILLANNIAHGNKNLFGTKVKVAKHLYQLCGHLKEEDEETEK